MASFNQLSAGDISSIDDMQKVRDYLYKLNKNLKYMFNNLTPEDNYSEQARLTLVTDGERQASIEATLNGINLNYVSKDGIVSAINLSEELIQIEASKIKLEGMVTVNGNFKVGLDGSIEAKNGKFSGDISASNITGSTVTGGHLYGTYIGTTEDNFFILEDGSDVVIGFGDGFQYYQKAFLSNTIGSMENPATGTDTLAAIKSTTGEAGFKKLYLLDSWYIDSNNEHWDVTRTLKWLDSRISALEARCWTDCGDSDDSCYEGDTEQDDCGEWEPDDCGSDPVGECYQG